MPAGITSYWSGAPSWQQTRPHTPATHSVRSAPRPPMGQLIVKLLRISCAPSICDRAKPASRRATRVIAWPMAESAALVPYDGEPAEGDPPAFQLACCEQVVAAFADHCTHLREARRRRRRALAVNTVVPSPAEADPDPTTSAAAASAIVPSSAFAAEVGVALETDKYEGDCVLRTLRQLLSMIDDRGFARSPQQCQFHDAFIRATSRVMYRQDWSKSKPMIMEHNQWDDCPSQILVSTPRRFGKTFS